MLEYGHEAGAHLTSHPLQLSELGFVHLQLFVMSLDVHPVLLGQVRKIIQLLLQHFNLHRQPLLLERHLVVDPRLLR